MKLDPTFLMTYYFNKNICIVLQSDTSYSRVLIGQSLIFCSPTWPKCCNLPSNVRQLNIRRGKKLGFQLSHRQPPNY